MKKFAAAFALLLLCACAQEPTLPMRTLPKPAPLMATRVPQQPKGVVPIVSQEVRVALLVPLSGESAPVGHAMLDAATMAVYDNYLNTKPGTVRSQVALLPKDTGAMPADAIKAAQSAVDENVRFFIGPLFSQSVSAIAPLVRKRAIDILSFSNNRAVAGDGVFVFGFLPEQQVMRVADYAYSQGVTRVAVLAPNDAYGQKVKDVLVDAYSKKGGNISPAEFYAPTPANVDAAAGRLAFAYNTLPEERKFQAIFIPEGGANLKIILASLKKYQLDLTKVKLLGTGQWDDAEISQLPDMRGAWFASAQPEAYRAFEKRFINTYGYKPVRLASLAYDAVTLATQLSIPSPSAINTASLINPQGFMSPANGLVRLRRDGTSQRALAVMEVTPSGFRVVDAAPKAF